ncbi:MAG: single-stranded-DNA-specific exonuclease RecJ [Clostridiales bacterium]|nr:single-stranded-DNA-specific exonuclease RecJ [Clostridiales bacterium]
MNLKTQKINDITPDPKTVEAISEKLCLNKRLVELLIMRGYDNVDAIKVFLEPDEENFYPPMSMLGMKECCERLEQAIENRESVVVYGDYDADGICASAILALYLSSRGLDIHTHIPDRVGEGYGLNVDSIERIIDNIKPDLILTCDCGISAIEEVELANDLGVDIIVTDHHEAGENLPDCVIVNPHQKNCAYPFKDLCGAGVALKIVQALGGVEQSRQYYDLAAIATIADLVSLTDENRLIVQLGLRQMKDSSNFGVLAIINDLNLKTVTASDIAFKIAPRINAAGRMGSAYRAFELFTSDDQAVVSKMLDEINSDNIKRKTLCDELYNEAISMLKSEDLVNKRAIIITSEKWEKGITGILAARLVGDFKRPTFVLVKNNDDYKGTCRSIEGINIYKILSQNSDILKEFGGHNQAAGFTILPENVEAFKARVYKQLAEIDEDMFIPSLTYDMELEEKDVTKEFALSLDLLEPTGNNGNPKPLFMTKTASMTATPLKTNINHTILRSPGGLQFFAYNSYALNTYYNGEAEREMIYELVDSDYSPRLYVRGCAVNRLSFNDALAKAGYLRLLNYAPSENPDCIEYDESELDSLIDNKFGILLIAGCKATYDKFAAGNHKNVIMHEIFAETAANVYTRVMVSPEFKSLMIENYNKIIFLDFPPSQNVIGFLNRRTKAKVYIPTVDNRKSLFSCVKADRAVFGTYFNAIKMGGSIKAPNVYAYFKALHAKNKTLELPQFVACLSVFTQLGLVMFRADAGVKINNVSNPLENSSIYRTIEAWQQ